MDADALATHGLWILGIPDVGSREVGLDEGWTDCVYANSFVAMVYRHAFGKQHYRSLRGGIRSSQTSAVDSQNRRDVDDGSSTCRSHVRKRSAGKQPDATHVDVERLIPLFGCNLLGRTGVKNSGIV